MSIDEFIEKCQRQAIPSNPMARVRLLARELAEGAVYGLWQSVIKALSIYTSGDVHDHAMSLNAISEEYQIEKVAASFAEIITEHRYELQWIVPMFQYFHKRWNHGETLPDFLLLVTNGYIVYDERRLIITEKAFDLLQVAEPASIFISYKRSESSAFALLIEQSLKQAGLSPFLDKQLQAGDDWHGELEKRIQQSDYLIILLGQETLKSEVTLREISWAIKYETGIIPIWHNKFSFNPHDWSHLDPVISEGINSKHAIRVLEENPLMYDTALRELLNRFGITL